MSTKRVQCIAVLLLGVPSLAQADEGDAEVEVGAFVGGHRLSANVELGNSMFEDQVPGDSMVFGARAAYRLVGKLRVEIEADYAPAYTTGSEQGVRTSLPADIFGLRVHATYDLFQWWRLQPFLAAGAGAEVLWIQAPQEYLVESDVDANVHWGLGVRIAVADRYGARVDARQVVAPGRHSATAFTYEATAGLYFTFGGGATAPGRATETTPRVAKSKPRQRAIVTAFAVQMEPAIKTEATLASKTDSALDYYVDEGPSDEEEPEGDDDQVDASVLSGIRFRSGRARITTSSRKILDRAARFLVANPHLEIEISGHADSTGGDQLNLTLSRTRADRVKKYLVDRGVAPERIETVGRGDASPAGDNHTSRGRARNRRIEFAVND